MDLVLGDLAHIINPEWGWGWKNYISNVIDRGTKNGLSYWDGFFQVLPSVVD